MMNFPFMILVYHSGGVPKGDPPRMPVPLFTARAVPLGSAEVFGAAAAANADWVEPAEAQP
jgi:hypothetical protein